MNLAESLQWRYATKKFDAQKKIDAATLDALLQTTALSASSLGLQPYRMVLVADDAMKQKLRSAAMDQQQLTTCSHVVVFAVETEINEATVERYMQRIIRTRNAPPEALKDFRGMCAGFIARHTPADLQTWAAKQAYIALGTLLAAASLQRVDACPMEGFDANAFDDILNLKTRHLHAVVMATLGYRASDDPYQQFKKVRYPASEMVIGG